MMIPNNQCYSFISYCVTILVCIYIYTHIYTREILECWGSSIANSVTCPPGNICNGNRKRVKVMWIKYNFTASNTQLVLDDEYELKEALITLFFRIISLFLILPSFYLLIAVQKDTLVPDHTQRHIRTHAQTHTSHSVGLLWASDRPFAETSTWQQTTITRHRHSCLRRDSNSQFRQASGRKLHALDRTATVIGRFKSYS